MQTCRQTIRQPAQTMSKEEEHIKTYESRDINLGALVRLLSKAPYLPNSQGVRNHLIVGLTSRLDPTEQRAEDGGPQEWNTLYNSQPGVQVVLFGDVPSEILMASSRASSSKTRSVTSSDRVTAPLWGIALVFPSKWRSDDDPPSFMRRPQVLLWMSSERALARVRLQHTGGDGPPAPLDETSRSLVSFVFEGWLPGAYQRYIRSQGERLHLPDDVVEQHLQEVDVVVAALDEHFLRALLEIVPEAQEGRDSRQARIEWHGTYGAFSLPLDHSTAQRAQAIEKDLQQPSSRWSIEDVSPPAVDAILQSNKIPFPRSHVLRKPFLSVVVRDRLGHSETTAASSAAGAADASPMDNRYALEQSRGSLAGWAYTHEDLSLASLHVPPAYRRLGAKGAGSTTEKTTHSPPSVGRLIVEVLSDKVQAHLKQALARFGCDLEELSRHQSQGEAACAWHLRADTEVGPGSAEEFYKRMGFKRMANLTWSGLKMPIG
ncbi:unnamed protein product [Jaminaea pallidilutea]